MRDDAVLRRALPLGRGLGRTEGTGVKTTRHLKDWSLLKHQLAVIQQWNIVITIAITLCNIRKSTSNV